MSTNPFIQDLKNQYKNGSALIKLIFVNVAVFLLVNILHVLFLMFDVNSMLVPLPGGKTLSVVTELLTANADISILISKPWSIITYMFLQDGLWHMFFNMLMLYFSGRLFIQYLGEKKLVSVYLLGGLFGFLFYALALNFLPFFDIQFSRGIMGASAAVSAILIAIASYVPNLVVRLFIIGEVKLKYVALFIVIMDIVSLRQGFNEGGYISHIGGALFGFLYIQQLKKGNDFASGFSKLLDYLKVFFKPQKKMKVVYKKGTKTRNDYEYNAQKKANQAKIDAILDKISKSGYDSLSKEEKAILFEQSKK